MAVKKLSSMLQFLGVRRGVGGTIHALRRCSDMDDEIVCIYLPMGNGPAGTS